MRVSLEWISDYVTLPEGVSPKQVAHDLTLKTVEVEGVIDDDVLEIDNKSLTNRPDLWGHYGIARELAAIYGLPLRPLPTGTRPPQRTDLVGTVDPIICQRLAAAICELDSSTATPDWMVRRLQAIGEKTVNLPVDLSNYVMFTVGQPTHPYDASALTLPLSAVAAPTSKPFTLLTGSDVEVSAGVPVIRDAVSTVAVAGIMGGEATSVTGSTRTVVLEAATFHPQPVRRASQRLGLRTEASARFEKALDTQRVDAALDLFLELVAQVGGTATGWQDLTVEATQPARVVCDLGFLQRRIGEPVPAAEIESTLGRLGFSVTRDVQSLTVTAPTWRSTGDVGLPHDIVEEIARLRGYDNLPIAPISVQLQPVRALHAKPLDRLVREHLATRARMQEVVTYPWSGDPLLVALGYENEQLVRTSEAPAPDRSALRPSLIPNLLDAVAANLHHQPAVRIFEVGTVFRAPDAGPTPRQNLHLAFAVTGTDGVALFREAKGCLEMLRRYCQLVDLYVRDDVESGWADPSAREAVNATPRQVGVVGLVRPRIRRAVGIGDLQIVCAEIDLGALEMLPSRENRYQPIPERPGAEFDLSVVVADTKTWDAISQVALAAHELVTDVAYVDEFRGSWVPEQHRSLSLRVSVQAPDRTLTAAEIGDIRTAVLDHLERAVGAYLRT
jgi:phenylalanyl-tRNA synthetase beta chain